MDRTALSFGVNLGRLATQELPAGDPFPAPAESARWAEEQGFDVVTTADHHHSASPFVMLAAAAAVTQRVRLRTYVLNIGFWRPGLLARDVATLDAVSGGRVEVGLGAGHKPIEHEALGLPYPPFAERVAGLARFAAELRRHLEDPDLRPLPVQRPVPLHVGAMSAAGLEVAATVGDLVALGGAMQLKGAPPGTLTLSSPAETADRVRGLQAARQRAGLPPARLDALLQLVVLDSTPQDIADAWDKKTGGAIRAEDIVDSPFFLAAPSASEAAEELLRRSERFGITSWCTHAPSGPALAQVMAEVRS